MASLDAVVDGERAFVLLVVGPHAEDANRLFFCKNFVDHAVLNVDAPGVRPRQVANQFFEGRWILKRVNGKDCQQFLRPRFEAACGKLFRILHCLLGVNNFPIHHSSAFVLVDRGSAMPALMDSRMPGTAKR